MENIVKPIAGIQPESQTPDGSETNKEFTQPEKVTENSPWSDQQIRRAYTQNNVAEGEAFEDEPMYRWACDLFGIDENAPKRDVKIIQNLITMAQHAVGNDSTEILKFLSKGAHEISGENKHRAFWRTLMLAQKAYKEVLNWG